MRILHLIDGGGPSHGSPPKAENMMRSWILMVSVVVCLGCAVPPTQPVLRTASGLPEVMMSGSSPHMWTALADAMVSAGYNRGARTRFRAVFYTDRINLGLQMQGYTRLEITFALHTIPGGLLLRARLRCPASAGVAGLTTLKPARDFQPGEHPKVERQLQAILEKVRMSHITSRTPGL